MRRKDKVEFRYYEMPEKEQVLALLGKDWIREYGRRIDYLHFHNYMEVGICHYGRGEVVIEEQVFEYRDGAIVIIPPNIAHTTNSREGTKSYWEWMYFDIESVVSLVHSKNSIEFREVIVKLYEQAYYLKKEENQVLWNLLTYIRNEMEEKQDRYRYSVQAYLQAFIVELLRMRHETVKQYEENHNKAIIVPAIEYVASHYAQEIKISVLSEACNISESHFRRLFQEIMKMKPNDYVNLIRIQNACEYIQKTNKSMQEIACAVGFFNISTFNRNFKKILGVSPYQWKRSLEDSEGKVRTYRISAQKGW